MIDKHLDLVLAINPHSFYNRSTRASSQIQSIRTQEGWKELWRFLSFARRKCKRLFMRLNSEMRKKLLQRITKISKYSWSPNAAPASLTQPVPSAMRARNNCSRQFIPVAFKSLKLFGVSAHFNSSVKQRTKLPVSLIYICGTQLHGANFTRHCTTFSSWSTYETLFPKSCFCLASKLPVPCRRATSRIQRRNQKARTRFTSSSKIASMVMPRRS